MLWNMIDRHEYEITLVNIDEKPDDSDISYVQGDAADLSETFRDAQFDIAFSNSVIEHVGDETRQELFAKEVKRVAARFWVQTPSPKFPLEVHTSVPQYWRLPPRFRGALHRRWREKYPAWQQMIEGTRPITTERMRELFPEAHIITERMFGFEKSIIAYN